MKLSLLTYTHTRADTHTHTHYVLWLPLKYILGFLIFLLRRSAEAMTGKGGKRGGLFGKVMESTAKLINSKDIGVRFQ